MRHQKKPPHTFLPPDEDRNTAIVAVARARYDDKLVDLSTKRVTLPSHIATFRRRLHNVLITYTPTACSNMQSSDVVRVWSR